jgi:maleamate amidohydrolase
VFVAERHRPNVDDFEANKLPEHCVDGQFDSELIEGMFPRGQCEFLLTKRRMSAFNATDLDLLLRELGVNRLIIGGVKANVCIRATVQDAFSLGYKCYVAKEAVNSNRNNLAEASLEDIDRYMGWVVPTLKAIELLS